MTRLGNLILLAAALAAACATETLPANNGALLQCRATKGAQAPAKPADTPVPNGNENDWKLPVCTGPALAPACPSPTVVEHVPEVGLAHVSLPDAITYAQSPPSSGNHRAEWAKWGEYTFLPPQRWLHNLEHGGAALLYHPCADAKIIQELRGFARCRPAQSTGGPFRWVLTPYAGLPRRWAIVTWQWTLLGDCFDPVAIEQFLDAHYRKTEEDFGAHGGWSYGYMGM